MSDDSLTGSEAVFTTTTPDWSQQSEDMETDVEEVCVRACVRVRVFVCVCVGVGVGGWMGVYSRVRALCGLRVCPGASLCVCVCVRVRVGVCLSV